MFYFLQRLGLLRRPDIPIGAPPLGQLAGPQPSGPKDERGAPAGMWAAMDSIMNTMSGLGTKGDKGQAGRPNVNARPLSDPELDCLYRDSSYARKIVDMVAEDATRSGWYVQDPTADVDPMADEDRRLQTDLMVVKAYRYARKYGLGLLVMAANDGRKMSEPLDLPTLRRVTVLQAFSKLEAQAIVWDTDAESPNFGGVHTWQISPGAGGSSALVHWTRVLVFHGDPASPREMIGLGGAAYSCLQSAWDAINALTTVDQAGATHAQELSIPVVKVGGLRAKSGSDQQAAFNLKMMAMGKARSLLNMILLGEDDAYEQRNLSLTGFDDIAKREKEALSAASDIPQTILFGDSPGGLNSDGESHRSMYNSMVGRKQKFQIHPQLIRLYRVLYAQSEGPTRGVTPQRWEVRFLPLEELTAIGDSENRKTVAETDKIYLDAGVANTATVAKSRFGPRGWSAEMVPVPTVQPAIGTPATDSATGIPLHLEVLPGEIRSGISPDGKAWAVRMPCAYGEIPGTVGADGEPVDVLYLGGDGQIAYIVEHSPGGVFDEDKVVLGAMDEEEAADAYRRVYGPAAAPDPIVHRVARTGLLDWLDARLSELEQRDIAGLPEEDRAAFDARALEGVALSPPIAVREELQRALRWHDAGLSGDGLQPETVAWARRLAAGKPISPAKALKAWAWFQRHASDQSAEGFRRGDPGYPSPGRVAHGLWMGDPGLAWVSKLRKQLIKRNA